VNPISDLYLRASIWIAGAWPTVRRKVWSALLNGVMLFWIGLCAYSLIRFPDGPIHPCERSQYCGKQGQPHSEADYREYERLSTNIFGSLPLIFLAGFLRERTRRLRAVEENLRGPGQS
jgi:hypothetical protein